MIEIDELLGQMQVPEDAAKLCKMSASENVKHNKNLSSVKLHVLVRHRNIIFLS